MAVRTRGNSVYCIALAWHKENGEASGDFKKMSFYAYHTLYVHGNGVRWVERQGCEGPL